MRIPAVLCATALAVSTVGLAHANSINLIQNGNFASTSPTTTAPTEFGTGSLNGFTATQFITNWSGNNGYEIWYPSASAATTQDAYSEWGLGSTQNTGNEKLYTTLTAPPGGTSTFVGLDGDQSSGVQSSIAQTLNDLTIGQGYLVTFNWGGSQLQSRTGNTSEYLAVSLGSQTLDTQTLWNQSGGFTGWKTGSLYFTANAPSETLSFLSVGDPTGYPPVAVLTNVSMVQAPEPGALALLGGGLLALGFALIQRRRAQQDRA